MNVLKVFITLWIDLSASYKKSKYFLLRVKSLCQFLHHFDLCQSPRPYSLVGGGNDRELMRGDMFSTFQEAAERIKSFCEKNFHPIKIHRSTVYDSCSKDFYYKAMVYACVHFGTYAGKGKGIRPKTKTHCTGCQVVIKLRLFFEPYMHYQIYCVNLKHNHEVGPKIYSQYVKSRSLTEEEKEFVKEILQTNAKNREIRLFVQENMNKAVTKSDISNIYTMYKKNSCELFMNKKNIKYHKEYFAQKWRKLQEQKKSPLLSVEKNNPSFNTSRSNSNVGYYSTPSENATYSSPHIDDISYNFELFENMLNDHQHVGNERYNPLNVETTQYTSQQAENIRNDSQYLQNARNYPEPVKDTEKDSVNVENFRTNPAVVENLGYNSTVVKNARNFPQSVGNTGKNSVNVENVRSNPAIVENIGYNSTVVENARNFPQSLGKTGKNSVNVENVSSNSAVIENIGYSSTVVEYARNFRQSIGDTIKNSVNIENVRSNPTVVKNVKHNSTVVENAKNNSHQVESIADKCGHKGNTVCNDQVAKKTGSLKQSDVSNHVISNSNTISDSNSGPTPKKILKIDNLSAIPTIKYQTERLSRLISESSEPELKNRLQVVAYLIDAWKRNDNILLFKQKNNAYTECLEGAFTLVENTNQGNNNIEINPKLVSTSTNTKNVDTIEADDNLTGSPGESILENACNELPSKSQTDIDLNKNAQSGDCVVKNFNKNQEKAENLRSPTEVEILEKSNSNHASNKTDITQTDDELKINFSVQDMEQDNSKSNYNASHEKGLKNGNMSENKKTSNPIINSSKKEDILENNNSVHLRKNETYANLILNTPGKEIRDDNQSDTVKTNLSDNTLSYSYQNTTNQNIIENEETAQSKNRVIEKTLIENKKNSKKDHFQLDSPSKTEVEISSTRALETNLENDVINISSYQCENSSKFKSPNFDDISDKTENDLACEVLEIVLTENGNVDLSSKNQKLESNLANYQNNDSSELQNDNIAVSNFAAEMSLNEPLEILPTSENAIEQSKLRETKICLKVKHKSYSRKRVRFSSLKNTPSEHRLTSKRSFEKKNMPELKQLLENVPSLSTNACNLQSVTATHNTGTFFVIPNVSNVSSVGSISSNLAYNTLPNIGMKTILVPSPIAPNLMLNQASIGQNPMQSVIPNPITPNIILNPTNMGQNPLQSVVPNPLAPNIILNPTNMGPNPLQSVVSNPVAPNIILNTSNIGQNPMHTSSTNNLQNAPSTVLPVNLSPVLSNKTSSPKMFQPRHNRFILPLPDTVEKENESEMETQKKSAENKTVSTQTPIEDNTLPNVPIIDLHKTDIANVIPFISLLKSKSKSKNNVHVKDLIKMSDSSSDESDSIPVVPRRLVHPPKASEISPNNLISNVAKTAPLTTVFSPTIVSLPKSMEVGKLPLNTVPLTTVFSPTIISMPKAMEVGKLPLQTVPLTTVLSPTTVSLPKPIEAENFPLRTVPLSTVLTPTIVSLPKPTEIKKPSLRTVSVPTISSPSVVSLPKPFEIEKLPLPSSLASVPNKIVPIPLSSDQLPDTEQTTTQKKLQNLKNSLTVADIEDIVSERMLSDKIINLGQILIKVRFPAACGLQDVLLGSALKFKTVKTNFIQILHCGSFPHWITISTINAPPATAYVYDSLNEPIPNDAVPQICNIMHIESSSLTVISKPMQIQLNNVDCGFFALASALTLLSGKDPSQTVYDVEAMRQHLLSGLMNNKLEEFPTLKRGIVVRSLGVTETFLLHCICRQPLLDDTNFDKLKDPYECTICKKWYHKQCKENCCGVDILNTNS